MNWRALITSFGLVLLAPSGALAAGLPVPPVRGGPGIAVPGSSVRFVAARSGRDTVLKRLTANSAHVQAELRVSGSYGIPGADNRGTLTGLSADGGTLILEPFVSVYPARTTRLLVIDTRHMRVKRTVVLRGWSVVDAISPHGRWMYLLHYSSANITRYAVLAYDLVRGRLLAKPIVDPDDRGKAMTGFPLARVVGPGGVWAYTLYARPSGVPFVHALDTAGLRAVCIDLPSLNGLGFSSGTLALGPGARTLRAGGAGLPAVTINTHTFAVSTRRPRAVAAAAPSVAHPARAGDGGGGGLPWELLLLPIAVAAAFLAAVWRRAKPRAA